MTEKRKLAAILCSDVVGFSRLAGANEDRILARLRALRSDVIDPTIAVHNGRVVKRTGDGSIVEFRSVVDAVRCASAGERSDAQFATFRRTLILAFGSSGIRLAAERRRPNAARRRKNKAEKAGVPATVVDGEQLESVLGIEALSSTGEDMGRIVDIIVDRDGQVTAAIIDFGGFLGVGSRKIAVDWRSLHFDPEKAGAVVVNLAKDQLRVAPIYKTGEPVVVIGGPGVKP